MSLQKANLNGNYFSKSGHNFLAVGAHWIPAVAGLQWPLQWNAASVEEDFKIMMRTENQIELYKTAGAAPALTAALNSDEVNVEDPYFGNEKVFSVFLESMGRKKCCRRQFRSSCSKGQKRSGG